MPIFSAISDGMRHTKRLVSRGEQRNTSNASCNEKKRYKFVTCNLNSARFKMIKPPQKNVYMTER
jgi:hypothetical protein